MCLHTQQLLFLNAIVQASFAKEIKIKLRTDTTGTYRNTAQINALSHPICQRKIQWQEYLEWKNEPGEGVRKWGFGKTGSKDLNLHWKENSCRILDTWSYIHHLVALKRQLSIWSSYPQGLPPISMDHLSPWTTYLHGPSLSMDHLSPWTMPISRDIHLQEPP